MNSLESYLIDLINEQERVHIMQEVVAETFNIPVQDVSQILQSMCQSGRIIEHAKDTYSLAYKHVEHRYPIKELTENKVTDDIFYAFFKNTPEIAYSNLLYAFQELLNNAIEHSGGTEVIITLARDERKLFFNIVDDGAGIFNKIVNGLNLDDKRYAILELSKGGFTSDKNHHAGEGIFFSSKCGDFFYIGSDNMEYMVEEDFGLLQKTFLLNPPRGTNVLFMIKTTHKQHRKELFDLYRGNPNNDEDFRKTIVPVKFLEYGIDKPLYHSRSQARRLMSRMEEYETVTLDFLGIESIEHSFADEIFRVFKNYHPDIEILTVNCCNSVKNMIKRYSKRS